MMLSPESFLAGYENRSYFELLNLKNELVQSIADFENDVDMKNQEWSVHPMPDVHYQWNLEVLGKLTPMLQEAFNSEYKMGDKNIFDYFEDMKKFKKNSAEDDCEEYDDYDDEKDFEDEDWSYEVGGEMDFLPREAVYSVQIELREIKKLGNDFEMTVAVRDPDSGGYQSFTEKVNKGSVLNWDGLEPGVVCFTGPDRVAVKLTVTDVSETSISFKKEYAEEE